MFDRANNLAKLFGFDVKQSLASLGALPGFFREYWRFQKLANQKAAPDFRMGKLYPCLNEYQASSGNARGAYFHQDLLVAQQIFLNAPRRHVDVASRVDGLVAHVASFREIEVFDIRRQDAPVKNVVFKRVDLMHPLPTGYSNYTDSLSCLHALEHFGLGRYGDALDPDGHLSGFRNLTTIVRSSGTLYLSVPIGEQRIEFNAHRVYSLNYLLDMFARDFEVVAFSYVNDEGDLFRNAALSANEVKDNFGCRYGCGIFELKRL